jgi:hypothetical protein
METTSAAVTEATSVTEATRVVTEATRGVHALDRRRTSRFPLHVCQLHRPVCELLPRQEREPWSMRMRMWSMRMRMQLGQRKGLPCSACAAAAFS